MRRILLHNIRPTLATQFPSLSRGHDINTNVHMFTQDVQLAVMPIGGTTNKHKNFAITLEGNQGECEKAEQLIAEIGNYDGYDPVEMVCNAVEKVVRHLAWEGCAVYEILRDDHDLQHIWGFTSKRLWRFSGYYLQIIPRGDWEHWKKKYVIVPADRIWYLGIPSVLGGRGKYKNILRRLEKFDHFGPEFWRQDLKQGVQSKNFDFQRYVRNTDIYYRKVTKTWGWNCRDWSRERTTDFYSFYKMVNFSWAQAILREHVINELNQLFVRLEIECEIKVSGLPTASDIMEVRTELLAGSISFGNVSDRVSL